MLGEAESLYPPEQRPDPLVVKVPPLIDAPSYPACTRSATRPRRFRRGCAGSSGRSASASSERGLTGSCLSSSAVFLPSSPTFFSLSSPTRSGISSLPVGDSPVKPANDEEGKPANDEVAGVSGSRSVESAGACARLPVLSGAVGRVRWDSCCPLGKPRVRRDRSGCGSKTIGSA